MAASNGEEVFGCVRDATKVGTVTVRQDYAWW
jgi:hypothetical protein